MRRLVLAAVFWMLASAFAPLSSQPSAAPGMVGRIGPYGGILTVEDARRMTADGLTLTVLSSSAPQILAALREGGAGYIDNFLWEQIHQRCLAQYAAQKAAGRLLACSLSDDEQKAIVQAAAAHLRQVESDPGVVAFWILDDYPHGDVSAVLKTLNDLVKHSNAASHVERPTICGIGGSLDAKKSPQDERFVPNHLYTAQSLFNVSPAACDLIAPYFYGTALADDPQLIDWSMKDLMPYFLQRLRDRGFDTSSRLLLPVSHAFSYKAPTSTTFYVMPRPEDIATQMKAYCDAGAFSMLFFTWQSQDADRSYSNDDAIRAGVHRGRAACLERWKR